MNPRITASGSQKAGATVSGGNRGATPFDEIKKLEKEENERVQKEIEAMEREREEVERAVAQKFEKAEEELKKSANEELKEYKETELAMILTKANKDAEKRTKELEDAYGRNSKDAVSKLVSMTLHADSSLFS